MLPTFLGIGAPKAGTTWLYQLLDSHPDVVMSRHRKEIHYFDVHFERGIGWYERFFPAPEGLVANAVGEFTTQYLYEPSVPARVRTVPSIARFLLTIRNPVDRAFSHFQFRRRQHHLTYASFEEFVGREPDVVSLGRYGRHLVDWLAEFDRSQFLILVYENAVREVDSTKRQIARFLGVDVTRFPPGAGTGPVNQAFVPRWGRLYATAVRRARWLRGHDLDPVITLAKRSGLVRALKQSRSTSTREEIAQPLRERLWSEFEDDVALLEQVTGMDLSGWRPQTLTKP